MIRQKYRIQLNTVKKSTFGDTDNEETKSCSQENEVLGDQKTNDIL